MAPLYLEGETLGQKHRHLNILVKAAVTDETWILDTINHFDPDPNNLLRIEVACGRKDVPYILEVFKSNDLLYVTRAIKRSTWLITDVQYAHIINPVYLEETLFPSMTAKAKSKLLFSIKQNLKDENRVDKFFNYYMDKPQVAMKWLLGCPTATIENFIQKYSVLFNIHLIQRLCSKSFKILKTYCKGNHAFHKKYVLSKTTNYLKSNCNEYLDIIDSIDQFSKPKFNKKATQIVMHNCRKRVIDNFNKYCFVLHIPTFAQNLKSEEVKFFLLGQKQNIDLKYWFKFDNIRHFLIRIPKNTRLEFIRSLTMDKDTESRDLEHEIGRFRSCSMSSNKRQCKKRTLARRPVAKNNHIYQWYCYAPFNIAMIELKKLIRIELLPSERNSILTVLIKCARKDQEHLRTLLEYYRINHINEPFKFKVQFVNTFLSHTKTHEFDDKTWEILNNIFSSMEIYNESGNKAPFCVDAIIVYNILHDQDIPNVIQEKFTFNTFQKYRNKLNENQQNKLFNYLYNQLAKLLENQKITNENEIKQVLETIKKLVELLSDWKRNLIDYPLILAKIKESTKIIEKKSWKIDLTELHKLLKCSRKNLFEESLIIHPSDEACLNALKHDPGLLSRYQSDIKAMSSKDSISIKRMFRKMRIYWFGTLAEQWSNFYLEQIDQQGQKAVKYVCTFMPYHQILPLIEINAPVETKINWNDSSNSGLILKKYIAKYMHLVRPSVTLDTVLLYAKGDYLYYSLPSLNAILYNVSSNLISEYITKLLNTPVSLQKHGISAIFRKLKYSQIKDIVSNLWKNNKNTSIKTILFKKSFELLCKEKNEAAIKDLWQLLNMYIDNLPQEPNRIIYNTFTKFRDVPITVRPLFFSKSYLYLKSLPAKSNCDKIIDSLFGQVSQLVSLLEPSFVEDVLLESIEDKLFTKKKTNLWVHYQILATYILFCKSEDAQMARYEKLLLPILRKAFTFWKNYHNGKYFVRIRSIQLLGTFINKIREVTLKQNIIPVRLYKTIQVELTNSLSVDENYEILFSWSIASLFVEKINIYVKENPEIYIEDEIAGTTHMRDTMPYCYDNKDDSKIWDAICMNTATPFGDACRNHLKEDTLFIQHPVLSYIVKEEMMKLFANLGFTNKKNLINFFKALLADKTLNGIYCFVIIAIRYMGFAPVEKMEILKILQSNTAAEVKIHMYYYNVELKRDVDNQDDVGDDIPTKKKKND